MFRFSIYLLNVSTAMIMFAGMTWVHTQIGLVHVLFLPAIGQAGVHITLMGGDVASH